MAEQGAEAELARFIDRETMEYVRIYPHPIERVWRAIVEPEEFGVWFIKGRLEPRVGGRYWFGDDGFQGVVAAIEPPRLLRLEDDNAGQVFQYELSDVAGGTRMRMVYRYPTGDHVEKPDPVATGGEPTWDYGGDLPGGPGTAWRPGFLGGWHEMFDALTDFLDGVPVGSRLPPTEFSAFVKKWAMAPPGMTDIPQEQQQQRMQVHRELRARERWFELIRAYRAHIAATFPTADPTQGA
jgi:uncharacterized protein YndB with AHSA1/START domain